LPNDAKSFIGKKGAGMSLQKIPLLFKVVSLYVTVAIAGSAFSYIYSVQSQHTAAQVVVETSTKVENELDKTVSGKPIGIDIDRLKVHLPIKYGYFDVKSGQWTLSQDSAYFAATTKLPNNKDGNTLIYGHNTVALLEPTKKLVKGDELVVTTKNGYRFHYRYTGDSIVNPANTAVLTEKSAKPRLTLLTCNGWLSENRRLMYFDFVGVSS
jgi:LPXTG-site transpeptidase (sortase) family protein